VKIYILDVLLSQFWTSPLFHVWFLTVASWPAYRFLWRQIRWSGIVVVQLLRHVRLFVTPWTAALQASLSFTISQSLLKLMSIESVMPSNHLVLCHPLLLPSIFPSIRVFSNESALRIRWPNCWSFSFSISPSNECSGLFLLGLSGLTSLQSEGLSRVFSHSTVQKHSFFRAHTSLWSLTFIHDYWKNRSFDFADLSWQSNVSAF